MYSELWQFVAMLALFAVAVGLWVWIVYLPGRTLERWEDQRARNRTKPPASDEREG